MAAIFQRLRHSYASRQLVERQLFLEANRREVLTLYRDILKAVSRAIPRKMEREVRLVEFKFVFRENMHEKDLDQINELKMIMYTVLEKIDNGVYPPFPRQLQV